MARVSVLYEAKEHNYFSAIREVFTGHALGAVALPQSALLFSVVSTMKKNKIDHVFFSSPRMLNMILPHFFSNTANGLEKKLNNEDNYKPYWGATFDFGGITFTCIPSLETVHTVKYGKFLISRYVNKILNPDQYITAPDLDWELVDVENNPSKKDKYLNLFKQAKLIALDIETKPLRVTKEFAQTDLAFGLVSENIVKTRKTDPVEHIAQVITCVGYCGLFVDEEGNYYSKSIVVPYIGDANYFFIKELNQLAPPKVMQNGKYDVIHLVANDLPIANWRYDTLGLMHSWYVELPRSLEFIAGFMLRNYMYWKDESGINIYEYNAKDVHNTLWACIGILQELPEYAVANFSENFIQVFPCLTCSLEGFAVDWDEFFKKKQELSNIVTSSLEDAQLIFGEGFNPGSPIQVKKILQYFGLPSAEDSSAKTMQKFADVSDWQAALISYVTRYRDAKKELSTYFEFPFLGNRWLFDLDPFGTETGRYASKKSSLWVGQQGQNFPASARSPYIPDPGYFLGASDNEQSESRCTAYMSEDANLIETVETSPDFHKTNASLFFGMPFEQITKDIRTLAKRVNHGANYNMGEAVLIETMGAKAVAKAKALLKLPRDWSLKQVAKYLLQCFDKAYPDIKGKYYVEVIEEIKRTNKLVGPTGWTRYCFGDPTKSKPMLNSYVAHGPQSLSVKIINRAFFKIWYEYQFKTKQIRLKMQKHDEIIWQTIPDNQVQIAQEISKIMAEPTEVRGRIMVIPNAPETGRTNWGQIGH